MADESPVNTPILLIGDATRPATLAARVALAGPDTAVHLVANETLAAFHLAEHAPAAVVIDATSGTARFLRGLEAVLPDDRCPVFIAITCRGSKGPYFVASQPVDAVVEHPFEPEHLRAVIDAARSRSESAPERRDEPARIAPAPSAPPSWRPVGSSQAFRRTLALIERVAKSDSSVLFRGETGAGKGILARLLHASSPRSAQAFVHSNCASVPAGLAESEFLGHERGSFTGAHARKNGLFESAHRGTLFLDELAELDASVQAKLLTVLEEGTFRRVGGLQEVSTDVRLVGAIQHDLWDSVTEGRFRRDLYFRVSVVVIDVPPLRERAGDVPLLAEHFLRDLSRRAGRAMSRLAPAALRALESYSWPGNVRELRNVIERALIVGDGEVLEREFLPKEVSGLSRSREPIPTLAAVERAHVARALECSGGNLKLAARWLGISRSALYAKLERHGLSRGAREDQNTHADVEEAVLG